MFKRKINKNISCPNCGKILKKEGFPGKLIIVTCPDCQTKGSFIFPKEKTKILSYKMIVSMIPFFLIFLIILLSFFLFDSNLLSLLSVLILIFIFIYYKFDCRIPIFFVMFLIIIAAFSINFFENEIIADKFLLYSYWLIGVSIICTLKKYFMKEIPLNI
jgi:phage FluMu protein Com